MSSGCTEDLLGKERSPEYTSSQRNFVCVLQIAPDGNPAGNNGNLCCQIFNTFVYIKSSGVSLHSRTQRQYDFLDLRLLVHQPAYQRLNF